MLRLLHRLEHLSNLQLLASMLGLSLILVVIGFLVSNFFKPSPHNSPQFQIAVSNSMLYALVSDLSPPEVTVINLSSEDLSGTKPPAADPINASDLVFYWRTPTAAISHSKVIDLSLVPQIKQHHTDYYWLSYSNALILSSAVASSLSSVYPESATDIQSRLSLLQKQLVSADQTWRAQMLSHKQLIPAIDWGDFRPLIFDYGLDTHDPNTPIMGYVTPPTSDKNTPLITRQLTLDPFMTTTDPSSFLDHLGNLYGQVSDFLLLLDQDLNTTD